MKPSLAVLTACAVTAPVLAGPLLSLWPGESDERPLQVATAAPAPAAASPPPASLAAPAPFPPDLGNGAPALSARGPASFGHSASLQHDDPELPWPNQNREAGAMRGIAGGADGGPAGACCTPDECLPASSEAECAALGGVFLPGEDCATDPCGVGACCSEVACTAADAFSCITAGRDFAGAGTLCEDDPCDIGVGACCIDGACETLVEDDCLATGGVFLGPGTICGSGPCVLGGCCIEETCTDLAHYECDKLGGAFVAGVPCELDPCELETDCPEGSLFSQQRDDPDDFIAGTSESAASLRRFEDFSGVAGTLERVFWWGLDLAFVGGAFVECEESDPTFIIAFHEDAGGQPGKEVCSSVVTATRVPTGILYLGAELNEYSAELPETCVLIDGWISIVGLGDPDCLFLWMSAGSGFSWCEGCTPPEQGFDLGMCLIGTEGGVFGACCDDATGTCNEGVEITDCVGENLRFAPDGSCADFDPPCGTIVGACCFEDATCSIEEEAGCTAAGGMWLGADTLCNQCPCITPCPAGGAPEGEPVCFDQYVDEFNGGCTADEVLFSPITLGETVCGTSGLFQFDKVTTPDFDWYEVVVEQPLKLTWTVNGEFPPRAWILDGNGGCPGETLVTAAALECDELSISAEVEKGRYWLVIRPEAFTDSSVCGARYVATLSSNLDCIADINGDGSVGFTDLLAILNAWGPCAGCPEDLDGSGSVGITDLLEVLSSWGPCGR